jgi:uncharacterized damage-inducible protein DinB
MDVSELLVDLYERILPLGREAVEGLDRSQLTRQPGGGANPIGWLVWHIGRVIDSQVAAVAGEAQVWESGDWARRVGLEPDPSNTGYGHSPEQVAAVQPEAPEVLVGYLEAVNEQALAYLRGLSSADLDRIVDRNFDPPVTAGVRLLSVAEDCFQHAGQAAYARGILAY